MNMLCSDKTGTLTLNKMVIQVRAWGWGARPCARYAGMHAAVTPRSLQAAAPPPATCRPESGAAALPRHPLPAPPRPRFYQDDCPTYTPGYDQQSLLLMAALAAKWREPPRDALDTLVLGSADLAALEQHQQVDFLPFDPTTKRTEGTIRWDGQLGRACCGNGR
jgi:magnesium-transporting ATPase (P-type)